MKPGNIIEERFKLEALAGRGGMSVVYRAHDYQTGQKVALKVLRKSFAAESESLRKEAWVLSKLTHPGIVQYLSYGQTLEGEAYLAMEWLSGEKLSHRIKREILSIEETLQLGTQIAEALDAAHSRGFVHRDIKPSNLFLVQNSVAQVKLLDFGIARLGKAIVSLDQGSSDEIVGTPAYMSPEQARGGVEDVESSADIFSFGCVLFECLTGKPAFSGKEITAILAKILLEEAPFVSKYRKDIPRVLENLIHQMMAKDANARPANGGVLRQKFLTIAKSRRLTLSVPRPVALTQNEQRLLCVALATIRKPEKGQESAQRLQQQKNLANLRKELALFGATVDLLVDDSIILTLMGSGVATDQAKQASRCTLLLRKCLPNATIALATGRGQAGPWPVGEVIDRVVQMIREEQTRNKLVSGVRIDSVTAGLLDNRFVIRGDDTGLILQEEQNVLPASRTLLKKHTPHVGRAAELEYLLVLFEQTCPLASPEDFNAKTPTRNLAKALSSETEGENTLDLAFLETPTYTILPYQDEDPSQNTQQEKEHSHKNKVEKEADTDKLSKKILQTKPRAKVSVVIASAGAGKSRLCDEFIRHLRKEGRLVEILYARGDSMRVGSPFSLLAHAIQRSAGIWTTETLFVKQQKLRARIARHLPEEEIERVTVFLGEICQIPFVDKDHLQLRAARQNPRLMGDQMQKAFEDWLRAECVAQPILLILEDLHWGDRASIQFIDIALRHLQDCSLMILGLARPEVEDMFPDLWEDHKVIKLLLGKLNRQACEQLIRSSIGENINPATIDRIVDRADGNPFYLEGLIRAVAEGKGSQLPETVLAMVQTQLERFSEPVRRVLRASSIFGRIFWMEGIQKLLGDEEKSQIKQSLETLVEHEILLYRGQRKFQGREEYTFSHSLVQETAYAMLTDADRSLGHRLAGAWLKEVGETDAIILAEHFARGKELERAIPWYKKAAEQSLEGNDLENALEYAKRGIQCGAKEIVLGELRCLQAEVHNWLAEFEQAERYGFEALRVLPRGSVPWYRSASEVVLASGRIGHKDNLIALGKTLLAIPKNSQTSVWEIIACARAVPRLFHAGKLEISHKLLARVKDGSTDLHGDLLAKAWVQFCYAAEGMLQGDYASFLRWMEAAAKSFEQLGDRRNTCLQRMDVGHAYFYFGAFEEAVYTLREVLINAEHLGLKRITAVAMSLIGPALAYLEMFEEAERTATQTIKVALAQGDPEQIASAQIYLALVYLLSNQLQHAKDEVVKLLEVLESDSRHRTYALGVFARIQLLQNEPQRALNTVKIALESLQQIGGLNQGESLIRLVHAKSLLATGQSQEAHDAIQKAREVLLERANKISDDKFRENFLSNFPEHTETIALANELCSENTLSPENIK